jgi:hypothetical protein
MAPLVPRIHLNAQTRTGPLCATAGATRFTAVAAEVTCLRCRRYAEMGHEVRPSSEEPAATEKARSMSLTHLSAKAFSGAACAAARASIITVNREDVDCPACQRHMAKGTEAIILHRTGQRSEALKTALRQTEVKLTYAEGQLRQIGTCLGVDWKLIPGVASLVRDLRAAKLLGEEGRKRAEASLARVQTNHAARLGFLGEIQALFDPDLGQEQLPARVRAVQAKAKVETDQREALELSFVERTHSLQAHIRDLEQAQGLTEGDRAQLATNKRQLGLFRAIWDLFKGETSPDPHRQLQLQNALPTVVAKLKEQMTTPEGMQLSEARREIARLTGHAAQNEGLLRLIGDLFPDCARDELPVRVRELAAKVDKPGAEVEEMAQTLEKTRQENDRLVRRQGHQTGVLEEISKAFPGVTWDDLPRRVRALAVKAEGVVPVPSTDTNHVHHHFHASSGGGIGKYVRRVRGEGERHDWTREDIKLLVLATLRLHAGMEFKAMGVVGVTGMDGKMSSFEMGHLLKELVAEGKAVCRTEVDPHGAPRSSMQAKWWTSCPTPS